MRYLFVFWLALLFASADAFGEESTMKPVPEAKNLIIETWCVVGLKFLYVEKTTNDTFQFFQIVGRSGMAGKPLACDGTETRNVK